MVLSVYSSRTITASVLGAKAAIVVYGVGKFALRWGRTRVELIRAKSSMSALEPMTRPVTRAPTELPMVAVRVNSGTDFGDASSPSSAQALAGTAES